MSGNEVARADCEVPMKGYTPLMTINSLSDLTIEGLRRFAKGVSVISAEFDGSKYAIVATAVSEVSIDPPTLLVCINQSASISMPMKEGADFAINFLSADQTEVAKACSGGKSGEDRFTVGDWTKSEDGEFWTLKGAQASYMCRIRQQIEVGTHTIFVGAVQQVHISEHIAPLVYFDGSYAIVKKTES